MSDFSKSASSTQIVLKMFCDIVASIKRKFLQAKDLEAFLRALVRSCKRRRDGLDTRGRQVGASNGHLNSHCHQLRAVGDLLQLRKVVHPQCLMNVVEAGRTLAKVGIVPASAVPSSSAVRSAYDCVRSVPGEVTNAYLYRVMYERARTDAVLRPYLEMVTRIWLLSAPESVVESMASVVKDVFGEHRQPEHPNAAMELAIRWNGPEMVCADAVVKAVQKNYQTNFVRTGQPTINRSMHGTVLTRHYGQQCPRELAFRGMWA